MKKIIPLLLLVSNASFAQLPTQQKATQFDKFINKPQIEWAAYINDTIRFQKINLNKLLFSRLVKNEIKISLPVGSGSHEANQIRYLNKKSIDEKLLYQKNQITIFDSLGNMIDKIQSVAVKIDTNTFTLTDATQILYVENGLLKTYTPWVATMRPVTTSTGIYLGEGDFFSTCFNFNYAYQAPKQNKILFLSQSKRKMRLDSFDVRSKLKELYGRNLIQTLWPYILKNKIEVFEYAKKRKLKTEDLTTDLVNEVKIEVPIYDSTGNQVGTKFVQEPLSPDVFTSMELVQDWYYDQTKNIVFTKIKEMILYISKSNNDGLEEPVPVIKLVFK